MAIYTHELYPVWNAMIARCYLPSNPWYSEYGGRGIEVCEVWRKNFLQFLDDMGPRPTGFTLERKDNNLGYYKENCEWVSYSDQNRNQRRRKNAISDETILAIYTSFFPTMMIARKYGVDKRVVGQIKALKYGAYANWICKKYKFVEGKMVFQDQ